MDFDIQTNIHVKREDLILMVERELRIGLKNVRLSSKGLVAEAKGVKEE